MQGKLLGIFAGIVEVRATLVERAYGLRRLQRKSLLAAIKEAGFRALEHWHEKFAPRHFTKSALFEYRQYGKYYSGLRRRYTPKRAAVVDNREKLPLVDSGHLREHILLPVVRGRDFSGTAKQTSLRMRYGRPSSGMERANKEIARLIDKYGMSREKATATVLRRTGYSPAMKQRFQELIPAVSPRESRVMANVFKKAVVEQLNQRDVDIAGVNA